MKPKTINVDFELDPKGKLKSLGGSDRDFWNSRLSNLVASALPVDQKNIPACQEAAVAAVSGIADINPTDPIEGMLIAQLVVAHEASLSIYRRAWQQSPEYFEARTKYLALADKATRTVAVLTERLDQHRGRGQQQITVKHITVNADQAVVTDSVVTGKPASNEAQSPAILLTAGKKEPMSIEAIRRPEPVGGGTKE